MDIHTGNHADRILQKDEEFRIIDVFLEPGLSAANSLADIISEATGDEFLDDREVVVMKDALMLAPSESSLPLPLPCCPPPADEDGKSVQTCIFGKRSTLVLESPFQ